MTWLRFKAFVLALLAFSFMSAACTSATCGWIIAIKALQNASGGGGGAGLDLSNAPFVTWDFNASLNNETPVWALTRSVVPAPASNASLTLGNSTNYFASVHALNGFFAFVSVGQQLDAFNASFSGNVSVSQSNTQLQPQFKIVQGGAGDASQLFDVGGLADVVSMGLDNSDDDNFELSNSSTLTGTTYSDENTLLRVHTEAGSEGILDLPHQSRARAYVPFEEDFLVNGGVWEQVNFSAETWDEKNEYDNAVLFRFTALEEGYYAVDVQLWVEGYVDWEAQLRRNGGSVVHTHMAFYSAGDVMEPSSMIHIHDVVNLWAGEYVEVWAFSNMGGFVIGGEDRSYFTVHKIS